MYCDGSRIKPQRLLHSHEVELLRSINESTHRHALGVMEGGLSLGVMEGGLSLAESPTLELASRRTIRKSDGIIRMASMLAENNPRTVRLAQEFATQVQNAMPSTSSEVGVLEIELSFGTGSGKSFVPCVAEFEAQLILTACEQGRTKWSRKDESWSLYYDTYILTGDRKSVRFRSVDGEMPTSIAKTLVSRLDLDAPAKNDLAVRLQAKIERPMPKASSIGTVLCKPEKVFVSTRRTFELMSDTLTGITYRYTIGQSWEGRTAQEAERFMQERQEPRSSVEVEVELPLDALDDQRVMFVAMSLLTKAQDIVEILSGERLLRKVHSWSLVGVQHSSRRPSIPKSEILRKRKIVVSDVVCPKI
jgi:hypothetical protein